MVGRAAATGAEAEASAARYLERQGLRILERNFRCRTGEIDLIATEGATLVFIEVRLRSSAQFGGAGASIDAAKQRRIIRAAQHYLAHAPDRASRFDVVLFDGRSIEWIRDAFSA